MEPFYGNLLGPLALLEHWPHLQPSILSSSLQADDCTGAEPKVLAWPGVESCPSEFHARGTIGLLEGVVAH